MTATTPTLAYFRFHPDPVIGSGEDLVSWLVAHDVHAFTASELPRWVTSTLPCHLSEVLAMDPLADPADTLIACREAGDDIEPPDLRRALWLCAEIRRAMETALIARWRS